MSETWSPRPYHPMMIDHIIEHRRCMLFAFMGAGKTSAILAAVDALMLAGIVHHVLIIAPLRVALSTWPAEVEKWANFSHLRVARILGDPYARGRGILASRRYEITVTNYENLEWLIEHCAAKWPFDMVIADECTRLKGARMRQGGRRAGALLKLMTARPEIRYVGLTGTPASNGLEDLYGQMLFVDQGRRLGRTYTDFENRWFGFQRAGDAAKAHKTFVKRVAFPHAQDEIQSRIKDVCLTLAVRDWFDIDEPIVSQIEVDLDTKARALYRQMEKDFFMDLEGHEIEAFSAAAKSQKLRQAASGALYLDGKTDEWIVIHDEKIEALKSIIEEANGAPIIVAYSFKSDLARLLQFFPAARHLDKREQTITDWNEGRIQLLIAHPQSAGHGLNLAAGGNILVFFSHDWSLENRLQIIERIGPVRQRQAGLERPVFLYDIVAKSTIDELVLERHASKRSVQDILLDAMKRRTSDAKS